MKKIAKKILMASVLVGMASSASAATANACDVWSWSITGAIPSASYTGTIPSFPGNPTPAIPSTSCVGVNQGNQGPYLNPNPNLGYHNDGLLNGQGGLLSPTQFIQSSQLQDLKGDGAPLDPGWIMLGILNGSSGSLSYSNITTALGTFNLGQFVTYRQTQDYVMGGGWSLVVDKDVVSKLAAIGLARSIFDHLAFTVKSSTYWAVYDFDFNSLSGFDLNQPYSIKGNWTTNLDFYNCMPRTGNNHDDPCVPNNGQEISHMAVWVRDPISYDVPAPATLFLLGAGLLALGLVNRVGGKS